MFEGSGVALVTPFKNGKIDEENLQTLVEFHVKEGTSTLVPCGTTGESATLTHQEHARVNELVVKAAKGRIKVLAGTGSNSTRETIEMTRHAQKIGADGALLITPYYNKPTPRGLVEHFRAVARAVSLPLVLYNVPGRTGINMIPATVIELARSEKNIVGIKEASTQLDQSTEIVKALGPSFDVLSGEDSLTLPILSVGGKGVISVAANIVPQDVSALCAAWKKGDVKKARALHHKMFPLIKALFMETNPIPVKSAMAILGMCSDELRLPLVPLNQGNREKLRKALRDHGVLKESVAAGRMT